jgi:hypothetical protein
MRQGWCARNIVSARKSQRVQCQICSRRWTIIIQRRWKSPLALTASRAVSWRNPVFNLEPSFSEISELKRPQSRPQWSNRGLILLCVDCVLITSPGHSLLFQGSLRNRVHNGRVRHSTMSTSTPTARPSPAIRLQGRPFRSSSDPSPRRFSRSYMRAKLAGMDLSSSRPPDSYWHHNPRFHFLSHHPSKAITQPTSHTLAFGPTSTCLSLDTTSYRQVD